MSIKRILVSWVGSTDLRLQDSPDESGPIQSVLQAEEFDELFLLHNYPQSEVKSLIEHIKGFSQSKILRKYLLLVIASRCLMMIYKLIIFSLKVIFFNFKNLISK